MLFGKLERPCEPSEKIISSSCLAGEEMANVPQSKFFRQHRLIRGGKYTNWNANFRKSGNYTRKVAKLHQHIGKKFWAMTSRPTSFERFWWDVKADSSFARQSYLSLKKRESYTSWFLSGKTGIVHQLSRNVEITCWNNECFFLKKFWTTDSICLIEAHLSHSNPVWLSVKYARCTHVS